MASQNMDPHNVQFAPGQFSLLEKEARRLGFFQTRGPGRGRDGSVAQLLQHVAELIKDGKLILPPMDK